MLEPYSVAVHTCLFPSISRRDLHNQNTVLLLCLTDLVQSELLQLVRTVLVAITNLSLNECPAFTFTFGTRFCFSVPPCPSSVVRY